MKPVTNGSVLHLHELQMRTQKETKKRFSNLAATFKSIILFSVFTLMLLGAKAQISVYQYRHVPNENVTEFIFRETNYWSKVARKAIDNKKMSFWGLFQKVGGYDLPNSSNFLFINTFSNIDSASMSEIWDPGKIFPGVPQNQIETNSISTTTSQFFLHPQNWAQDEKAMPDKDFNYVVMVYHNTNYPDSLINMENKYWAPFIKTAMDKNQTPQMAWGNATVLAPRGDDIKFTTVSFDVYKTLQDALMPNWNSNVKFPEDGLSMINNIELSRRGITIYRVVKVESSN